MIQELYIISLLIMMQFVDSEDTIATRTPGETAPLGCK